MDPFVALAVAGNILQFVQFVGGLFSSTRKIYLSMTGIASDAGYDICEKLIGFSSKLEYSLKNHANSPNSADGGQPSEYGPALAECAASCREDCAALIEITRKLRQKAGGKTPRWWKSFHAALEEVWRSNEIDGLQKRIADRQRWMIIQLCAISNENAQRISEQLVEVRAICNVSILDSRFSALSSQLSAIRIQIARLNQQECASIANVEDVCGGLSQLSLDAQQYAKEAAVQASLDYSERPKRHDKIPDAHEKTFQWGLEEDEMPVAEKSGSLRRWLSNDDGLFWVSGKPGSGKSTFMKFIADNSRTESLLQRWSSRYKLVIVTHYFTIYGTPIQRSLEGLLRSLLYGILSAKPNIIPKVLPERWETGLQQSPWNMKELQTVLGNIAARSDLGVKICFFIDGLDEYEGDHMGICWTLKELAQSSCIKICVSSRPWNLFEDLLGRSPDSKLYMHELTHKDIRSYTSSAIHDHPRWQIPDEEASPITANFLVEEVVSKANGVFLWVTVVTRLLRDSLTDGDSLSDIKRRLSSFPSDLKGFFKHILESVDSFYHEKMAGTLLIALQAKRPLSVEMYMFHEWEYDDNDYALKEPAELLPIELGQTAKLFAPVFRRINGRCKGLLERNGDRIEFLHRTVFDFLKSSEMDVFLREKARVGFCPSLSLCRAAIAWTKRLRYTDAQLSSAAGVDDDPFARLSSLTYRLRDALPYAADADAEGNDNNIALKTATLLDNMELSLGGMLLRRQIFAADTATAKMVFRHLVLEAGVDGYLRNKLGGGATAYIDNDIGSKFRSPISSVLRSRSRRCSKAALILLLQSDHDVNRPYPCGSPWTQFLSSWTPDVVLQKDTERSPEELEPLAVALEKGLFDAMLQYGAEPEATVGCQQDGLELPAWVRFLLQAVQLSSFPHYLVKSYQTTLSTMLESTRDHHPSSPLPSNFPHAKDAVTQQVLATIFEHLLLTISWNRRLFQVAQTWFETLLSHAVCEQLRENYHRVSAGPAAKEADNLSVKRRRDGQVNEPNGARPLKQPRNHQSSD